MNADDLDLQSILVKDVERPTSADKSVDHKRSKAEQKILILSGKAKDILEALDKRKTKRKAGKKKAAANS